MNKQIGYIAVVLALAIGGCGASQKQATLGMDNEQESYKLGDGFATPIPQSIIIDQLETNASMPTYEVVDSDTYDAPIKTQIEFHAVVSGTITELGLNLLLQKLYDEANATRGFKYYGGKPTHVFIYLYTSLDHFKSGMGQWIAMLSKVGEDSQIDTQIRKELIQKLHAKPEIKHDLTESKRKEIFKAIVGAEDRADKDAQLMYPIPDPMEPGYSRDKVGDQWKRQVEAFRSLMEKYRSQVDKRYGITEEQLHDISIEGLTNNWPIPPMP